MNIDLQYLLDSAKLHSNLAAKTCNDVAELSWSALLLRKQFFTVKYKIDDKGGPLGSDVHLCRSVHDVASRIDGADSWELMVHELDLVAQSAGASPDSINSTNDGLREEKLSNDKLHQSGSDWRSPWLERPVKLDEASRFADASN